MSTLAPQVRASALPGGSADSLVNGVSQIQAQQDTHQVRVSIIAFTLSFCEYEGVQQLPFTYHAQLQGCQANVASQANLTVLSPHARD